MRVVDVRCEDHAVSWSAPVGLWVDGGMRVPRGGRGMQCESHVGRWARLELLQCTASSSPKDSYPTWQLVLNLVPTCISPP